MEGDPTTWVVRDTAKDRWRLWHSGTPSDVDELRDRAQERENAGNKSSKRKQRFDSDTWLSAGSILEAAHPASNRRVDIGDIHWDVAGEFIYRIKLASLGAPVPLEAKPSAILAGRWFPVQTLIVVYALQRQRFDSNARAWLDMWVPNSLQTQVCTASLAGRCNDPNCGRIHPSWTCSEISSDGPASIHRAYFDRGAERTSGPIAGANERSPWGDGLALAHLMDQKHTNASIDEDSSHLLNQFERHEGTPRKDYRSSAPNEQVRALPTACQRRHGRSPARPHPAPGREHQRLELRPAGSSNRNGNQHLLGVNPRRG